MSFQSLNKDVLRQVAEEFAVDWSNEDPTKKEMIEDLKEEGVTWEMYKQAFPDEEEQPEVEEAEVEEETEEPKAEKPTAAEKFTEKEERVLVRMMRGNAKYQIRGYTFTREHPFMSVQRADADFLIREAGGFRIASPDEVESYYN
jgi:hypothetical protein